MSYVLEQTKQQQVLALGRLGWPVTRIAAAAQVDRATVTRYLRAAGLPVRGRGRPSEATANAAISGREVSTDPRANPAISSGQVSTDSTPSRSPQTSACALYREEIADALARGRNAMGIWQDLVDRQGFRHGYASVRRFVRTLQAATPVEARVIITTAPGEEGQVDYGGDGPMVRDAVTGKYRRARLFVLTLGFSRKAVRLLTWRSSAQIWAELHEQAFRRLGGTVKVIVLDNLGEGVLTPDIYDPRLNPLYRDVLAHYGVVALPCRVGDPDRKGKVEAGVRHAQQTPLRGQRFESLEAAQAYLDQGKPGGPIRASTARRNGRSPPCLRRSDRRSGRCPSSRFAITASGRAWSISMAASKSRRRITARHPVGSAVACRCSGMTSTSACSTRRPVSCCESMCARRAGIIGSLTRIGRRGRRPRRSPCSSAPPRQARRSVSSVGTSRPTTGHTASARSSACSRSPRSTARRSSRMRRARRWISAS
jgi:transposase